MSFNRLSKEASPIVPFIPRWLVLRYWPNLDERDVGPILDRYEKRRPIWRPLLIVLATWPLPILLILACYLLFRIKGTWIENPTWWLGFVLHFQSIWLLDFRLSLKSTRSHIEERGLCAHCGYDLRGRLDTGCPECGALRQTTSSRDA